MHRIKYRDKKCIFYSGCMDAPTLPPLGATYDFTGDTRKGTVVVYECALGFSPYGEYYLKNECDGVSWHIPSIPYICRSGGRYLYFICLVKQVKYYLLLEVIFYM